MRGACCLVILLILLPIGQSALSSHPVSGSETVHADVRISEILPRFPSEHIGIANLGQSDVDLIGWAVSDGEGWWHFTKSMRLPAGKELFIGPNATFLRLLHPGALTLGTSELGKKGRLALADEGDEAILLDPQGNVADAVAYGRSDYSDPSWKGEKCPTPAEGKVLRRGLLAPYCDSDTKDDWAVVTPGRSSFTPISSRSTVEPFLCPDHMRARLLREIAFAHSSIALEVYILSDPNIAGALASASSRGVQVRTLVEGEPVGGLSNAQVSFLQALGKAGCEVFQSFGFHGFKRYDYLHPKFMV
ncbi:MAG: lamin tail domain-containing protein, partial [Methanomassiliicoccales archaeon]|nr:lamin tail domain-containing protein [Methanomassiliicoccales archaeon]